MNWLRVFVLNYLMKATRKYTRSIRKKWWLAASLQQHTHPCTMSHAEFWGKHQITRWLHPLQPRFVALQLPAFPKLKLPLKEKSFQTINEIQENTTGQLMAIGRTVWGPYMPTLKGTEVSLSHVQSFSSLVFSSINVSFSYYMAGHLLERPHIYKHTYLPTHLPTYIHT